MVKSFIEVSKVKGLSQQRVATFFHTLVQDFMSALVSYPIGPGMDEEIHDKDDLQSHLRNLLYISKPKFVEDEREY